MPVACVHAAHSHSLYIVLCAMLNILVMTMMEPLFRQSSVAVITSMEIASNHSFFKRSFFLGLVGGASLSEASMDSIVLSNWYAKL